MHSGAFQPDADQLFGSGFNHSGTDLPVVVSIDVIVSDADSAAKVAEQ